MSGEMLASGTGLVVLLLALALLQFAVFVYTAGFGRSDPRFGNTRRFSANASAQVDNHVTCSQCGAENEAGYRFCRNCVSTLPGAATRRFTGGRDRTPV